MDSRENTKKLHQITGNMKSVKTSDYIRQEMFQSERVMRHIRPMEAEQNRQVGMCVILDLEGFCFDPYLLGLISTYFARLEEIIVHQNYPLIDERIILINAPRLLASIGGILKKMWPSIKIHMLGPNYLEKLLEIVDECELPAFLGGAKPDADLDTPVILPQKVPPKSIYDPIHDPVSMTKIQIRAKRKIRLISQLEIPSKSTIRWFFKGDHDISFGVFRAKNSGDENSKSDEGGKDDELLVPKYRSKADLIPDDGELTVESRGIYAVEFCNHHSMLTVKTVHVSLEFRTPSGKKIEFREIELCG